MLAAGQRQLHCARFQLRLHVGVEVEAQAEGPAGVAFQQVLAAQVPHLAREVEPRRWMRPKGAA